jgi:hypothetical protein
MHQDPPDGWACPHELLFPIQQVWGGVLRMRTSDKFPWDVKVAAEEASLTTTGSEHRSSSPLQYIFVRILPGDSYSLLEVGEKATSSPKGLSKLRIQIFNGWCP